jgi:hypothetical protein
VSSLFSVYRVYSASADNRVFWCVLVYAKFRILYKRDGLRLIICACYSWGMALNIVLDVSYDSMWEWEGIRKEVGGILYKKWEFFKFASSYTGNNASKQLWFPWEKRNLLINSASTCLNLWLFSLTKFVRTQKNIHSFTAQPATFNCLDQTLDLPIYLLVC